MARSARAQAAAARRARNALVSSRFVRHQSFAGDGRACESFALTSVQPGLTSPQPVLLHASRCPVEFEKHKLGSSVAVNGGAARYGTSEHTARRLN
eukprot:366332-Chlamydomonas_euryale.AAC.3